MALRLLFITDGKPGHLNQLRGLEQAFQQLTPVDSQWLYPGHGFDLNALRNVRKPIDGIIAAGHKTHGLLLLSGVILRAPTVVLMKPSLPLAWFNHAVIPAHDGVSETGNVILTEGVLNRITPSHRHNSSQTMILIGGPSKHYHWQPDNLIKQIRFIVDHYPEHTVTMLTSRRTPQEFSAQIARCLPKVELLEPEQTRPETLPQLLAEAGQVWVTEDSVSMMYEALTAGARVGLLALRPRVGESRVAAGVERLKTSNWITPFADFQRNKVMTKAPAKFHEAKRVALIMWPLLNRQTIQ